MTAVIQMKPEGRYLNADLERLANELADYLGFPEVMDTQTAARFLGISASKLYRIDKVPSHRMPELRGKIYLKSELIEYIKKH